MRFFYYEWETGHDPDQDGMYYVARAYFTSQEKQYVDIATFEYTIEGGWNTHRDRDGKVFTENRIDYSDRKIYWMPVMMVKEEEKEKWVLTSQKES